MKKGNLLANHQHKNIKVGKRIKFTLDLKNENSKQNNKHNLSQITKEKSEKEKEAEKIKEKEIENNILEDKDYLAEFKEKNNLEKKEEKKNENNDDLKLYEDNEEDEYFNQPLMKVHRMSMKKKELGRIRNNLKKQNKKKPESINNVTIDRNKAQQMAQNFFKTRLKYFYQIRMNSESNDKNISDYAGSKPKRHFKNILSNNSDIDNDFTQEKNNTKRININTNKYKFEDENEKHNINLKKVFRRLPTDIYKNNYDNYLTQDNLEKNEESKEKEKTKNIDKIGIKEKEEKKGQIKIKKEEIKVIPKKEIKEVSKKEIKEIPKKEIKEVSKKEIKEIPKKEIKEIPKKEIKEIPKIEIKEEQKKEIKDEIKHQIPINKRDYRRRYNLSNLGKTNIVNKRNNWSYSFNNETNKTASSIINTTQQNIKPKKELNQDNEEKDEKDEKENLSSFRYRRKFKQKEKKNEEEEPKLVYKAAIRVNKRIFQNNENTKKEPAEKKYQKFKEIKVDNKYNTEENLRNKYREKKKQNEDEINKIVEKEKIKENNDNNNKTISTAFYRRRVIKKI